MTKRNLIVALMLLVAAVVLRPLPAFADCSSEEFVGQCSAAQNDCDRACNGGDPGCSYCMGFTCSAGADGCLSGTDSYGCSPWTCGGDGCYEEGQSCDSDMACCGDLRCLNWECHPQE
jgi:hypothetical protein